MQILVTFCAKSAKQFYGPISASFRSFGISEIRSEIELETDAEAEVEAEAEGEGEAEAEAETETET